MNRRSFCQGVAALLAAPALPVFAADHMPEIEYAWIPPRNRDRVDPYAEHGYCGGKIEVNGKQYGSCYPFTHKAYFGREEECKREMERMVEKRMRSIWEAVR